MGTGDNGHHGQLVTKHVTGVKKQEAVLVTNQRLKMGARVVQGLRKEHQTVNRYPAILGLTTANLKMVCAPG